MKYAFGVLSVVTACNLQMQTTSSSRGRSVPSAHSTAVATDFAVTTDGPIELVSQHDEAPGTRGQALCKWTRTYASKAHLGGGRYGEMVVPISTLWATPDNSQWIPRTEPVLPCAELERAAKSDADVVAGARQTATCGSNCVRAAHWIDRSWNVQRDEHGPVQMHRTAEVLAVVRPAGAIANPPLLDASLLTSNNMKTSIANACKFPNRGESCRVTSAAIHHVVRFFDDSTPTEGHYEVLADVTVELGGVAAVCEMRMTPTNHSVGEGQCRSGSGWDPRCFTDACVTKTAQLRAQ